MLLIAHQCLVPTTRDESSRRVFRWTCIHTAHINPDYYGVRADVFLHRNTVPKVRLFVFFFFFAFFFLCLYIYIYTYMSCLRIVSASFILFLFLICEYVFFSFLMRPGLGRLRAFSQKKRKQREWALESSTRAHVIRNNRKEWLLRAAGLVFCFFEKSRPARDLDFYRV